MNPYSQISLAHKIQECAQRWQATAIECPECHGTLYQHTALGNLGQAYQRCPSCRMNFCDQGAQWFKDRPGEQLLDALVKEAPSFAKVKPIAHRGDVFCPGEPATAAHRAARPSDAPGQPTATSNTSAPNSAPESAPSSTPISTTPPSLNGH